MPGLTPVDYDPFKKGPALTPVDHDPFAKKDPEGAALAAVPGARITSTRRSAEHNAAVGGVPNSRHLTGDAVDFIPPAGMTRTQAEAAIRARDPHPKELLDEGDHVHYSPSRTPTLTPVDHDPFAKAAPQKQPVAAPAAGPAAAPKEGPADAFMSGPREAGRQFAEAGRQVEQDEQKMFAPGHTREEYLKAPPAQRAQMVASDAVGALSAGAHLPIDVMGQLWSPIQGFLEGSPGRVAEEASGGKVSRKFVADVIGAAAPFAGEVHQGMAVSRLAREAGVSEVAAAQALAATKATKAALAAHPEAARNFTPEALGNAPTRSAKAKRVAGAAETERVRQLPEDLATGPAKAPTKKLQTFAEARSGPKMSPDTGRPALRPQEGVRDETIPETLQRHEDGLYRLEGEDEAAKVNSGKALDALGKEPDLVVAPADRERLLHFIEGRKPGEAPPEDLKKAYDLLAPRLAYDAKLRAAVADLRPPAEGEDEHDPENGGTHPDNYVHRVRMDKTPGLQPKGRQNPITGGMVQKSQPVGRFARSISGDKARKYPMLEDAEGNRTPAPKREKGDDAWRPGETHQGSDGKSYTVRHGTVNEIEGLLDPEAKYLKDPFVTTEMSIMDHERQLRNTTYLKSVVGDMVDRDLAVRAGHYYKDEKGKWQWAGSNANIEEAKKKGFVEVQDIPELKGVYVHPRMAEMFSQLKGEDLPAPLRLIENASRLMVGAMFFNPLKHDLNIANMWWHGRGFMNFTPRGAESLMKNGLRAILSVNGQDADYVRALREGVPLQFSRAANADFFKMMIRKAGIEITEHPEGWDKIAKQMGLKHASDLVKGFYSHAQKEMWRMGDIMMMQRWYELQDQGMNPDQARAQAGKEMADYRIPTEAFGSSLVSRMMKSRALTVFGPFHYNLISNTMNVFKNVVKGTEEEKKLALGSIFTALVTALAIAPVANFALRKATGNQNAKFQGAGYSGMADRAISLAQGDTQLADFLSAYITPAPGLDMAYETVLGGRGMNPVTGKPFIEPDASPLGKLAEGMEYAGEKVPPIQTMMQAGKPGGALSTAAGQVDVALPSDKQMAGRERGKVMRKKEAAKREARDPLEHLLKGIIQ